MPPAGEKRAMLKRISLTIEGDLLSRVDRLVDGVSLKNRSHTISALLRQAIKEKGVARAFVLAGKNSFLLEKILAWLKRNGIHEVVIACGGNSALKKKISGNAKNGLEITFVTDENKGTALALEKARGFLKEPFLLCYSDVFCEELELRELSAFHEMQKSACTLVLTWSRQPSKYGVAKMEGAKVTAFVEKPHNAEGFLINAGVALCTPGILNNLEGASFEKDSLPTLAKKGGLAGYVYYGKWSH